MSLKPSDDYCRWILCWCIYAQFPDWLGHLNSEFGAKETWKESDKARLLLFEKDLDLWILKSEEENFRG